ncbi:hypothetical protein Q1695_012211 [Nippostrongylus brasiliensis]|nr:hypothetical protein Q1695_012211 [Nippostrongylus brasiliensis]
MELLEQRRAVKLDPNASHLEKVTISKACRLAVKESIQAYRRLKLLEAAQKGSSIKRCKRDLMFCRRLSTKVSSAHHFGTVR